MKFEEILHHYQICSYSEHGIAFHRITPSFYEESSADVIIEEHSILIVTAGQLNIELAGKPYCLTGNSLVDTGDEMIPLRILQQSADIQASLLILSKQFRRELLARRPTFPISYLMRIKLHPILTVDTERLPSLRRCMDNIVSSMDECSHRFQKDILLCKTHVFLMELADIRLQPQLAELPGNKHAERLFLEFINLLSRHVRQEHGVGFYASELCVTTQYLGRIVRQFTGKTVYHWICEALVREIAQLLSDTDASLQEISDQLHFSDQAVMSKMFKRLQGIPPSVYRDQIARRRTELPAPHSVC